MSRRPDEIPCCRRHQHQTLLFRDMPAAKRWPRHRTCFAVEHRQTDENTPQQSCKRLFQFLRRHHPLKKSRCGLLSVALARARVARRTSVTAGNIPTGPLERTEQKERARTLRRRRETGQGTEKWKSYIYIYRGLMRRGVNLSHETLMRFPYESHEK